MDGDNNASTLSDQIYKDLKWSLIIGVYRPDDVLSIRTLAAKLGVSAMPVREALKRLASERLLVSAAKKSYSIAGLDPVRVSNQFFVRAHLESVATAIATKLMTEDQISSLQAMAVKLDKDVKSGSSEQYVSGNYNFHFAIYTASNNDELVWSIERLWALTGPFLAEFVRSVDLREMSQEWRGMHIEIAEMIAKRDAKRAAKLIEQDISWGTNTFLKMTAKR